MSATADSSNAEAAQQASGSSFYLAMRILPREKREAMFQVYKFCREVDDIADTAGPRDARIAALDRYRADVASLYGGLPPGQMKGFVEPLKQFGFRKEDFLAVIDGMEMDVISDIRAPDLATLDLYCDRVASAVGRLSVKVFGVPDEDGIALSHHLGRALQLTNILRDVDEDADIGRLYLPREYLTAAGIATTDPKKALASPRLGEVCAPLIAQAREHFKQASAIMDKQTRASVKAPRIMAEAYAPMLDALEKRGFNPPRHRVRMNRAHLIIAILRYAFI
ncbi:presqualene diphosphate synthase HpnD [Pseudorhodoplanes sinuspersici]|uniref:Squalene synthase HpnD n=1 Tax=Pseudorhodoplanes sinuspersici TaxID=1235591 RepID=A0A1W6ZLZ6_9HYPH|nr:presqualene diphosphate synthase HpnD [Pseudorhodoplanes sinuspersici]ARP98428.1 squalene synthase HpnD [Pseudorhodoplanes sinuspersici]RKE66098.1 farnesyl-diphosphate farnesyltransferase [Pseudorhodoplanes sinuspersici]